MIILIKKEGAMLPTIDIFGKDLPMYAIFALIGILIAGTAFCVYIDKCGYDNNRAIVFLLFVGLGVVIGGHTLYAITNINKFYLLGSAQSFTHFLSIIGVLFGGSVFYGGLIGALVVGFIYIKATKIPIDIYMDGCAFFAPLFHSFARVGCFFAGCCYGIESSFGFICERNENVELSTVRRFPVQLLESFENLVILLVIIILMRRKKQKGGLFYIYLILYTILRFMNEFLRGDEIRGFVFGMSTSQLISILIFIASSTLFVLHNIKTKNNKKANT